IDMTAIIILWFAFIVGLKFLGLGLTTIDETGEKVSKTPYILMLLIFWGYYLVTEYLSQRTIGKFLTKTIVVSIDGERPKLKQIIFRTLSRSIPFEYFSYL